MSNAGSKYPPELVDKLKNILVERYGESTVRAALDKRVGSSWSAQYVHRNSGKLYVPHHEEEHRFVYSDSPRYMLCRGGEGSGKSVAGIIKALERLRRGCSGVMVSPDLPHLKISLWPEFQLWCPWDQVVDKFKPLSRPEWSPRVPFQIVFKNGAKLDCRGIDSPESCEGANVNFVHFDEARHKKKALALKVLDGRVRIPGPNGEPPQMWLTTTPRKNWLFDYFGGLRCACMDCGCAEMFIEIQSGEPLKCKECESPNVVVDDEFEAFKRDTYNIKLFTKDNEGNVQDGFAKLRAQTLTEAEARVLLDAEWEDIDEGQPYLPHISWWDDCREELPPLSPNEPLVLAVDSATGRTSGKSDCFSIVGITPHPVRPNTVAVRYVRMWQAGTNGKIDYRGTEANPGPERELLRLCGWTIKDEKYVRLTDKLYNVKCITYDPDELHDLGMRFARKRIAWMDPFGQQGSKRVQADTDLLLLIRERRIAHDGNPTLRQHIYNADRKLTDGRRLRMVKRSDTAKIDGAVCTSMGAFQCLFLNLTRRK